MASPDRWAPLLFMSAACENKPPSSPAPPPSATKRTSPPARSDPGVVDVSSPQPPPSVDDRDAPGAPAALPRSYTIAGWIKHEPVRVVRPGELASLIADPTARAALESYRLESVAHCVYRYGAARGYAGPAA